MPNLAWLFVLNAALLETLALICAHDPNLRLPELRTSIHAADGLTVLAAICIVFAIAIALKAAPDRVDPVGSHPRSSAPPSASTHRN